MTLENIARRSETLRPNAHATAKWGNLRLAEAGWRGRQPGGNSISFLHFKINFKADFNAPTHLRVASRLGEASRFAQTHTLRPNGVDALAKFIKSMPDDKTPTK